MSPFAAPTVESGGEIAVRQDVLTAASQGASSFLITISLITIYADCRTFPWTPGKKGSPPLPASFHFHDKHYNNNNNKLERISHLIRLLHIHYFGNILYQIGLVSMTNI